MSLTLSDTKYVPAGDRFDLDIANSSGLSLRVRGGIYAHQLGFRSAPNATLTLTASATNYVEADDAGVVTANTTGFTAGATALYRVTTGAALVTGVEDWRGSARLGSVQNMTASGAIRADAEFVTLSKSGVLAATIAAPVAGRRLVITQIDTGTDGHTVTLTAGTWDGTTTIATFNALGETLEVFGVTALRFVIISNIGAVGLS